MFNIYRNITNTNKKSFIKCYTIEWNCLLNYWLTLSSLPLLYVQVDSYKKPKVDQQFQYTFRLQIDLIYECLKINNMERWLGEVAIVTGASAGIGVSIVVDFVKACMIVVGLARRSDVADDTSVVEAFKWISYKFMVIHVLINNAGIVKGIGITDVGNEEILKSVLQTNLWRLVLCTKNSVEIIKREKATRAKIININRRKANFKCVPSE